tara:strand:- start:22 stop:480 length:459 start_codon:yes stop_codon:yes gene_type:complete
LQIGTAHLNLIIALKILHYVALFLAGGAGVANPLLIKAHKSSGIPPSDEVQETMLKLVKLSLIAMILIWISGVWLAIEIYGTLNMGWAFTFKIIGASILLISTVIVNLYLVRRAKINAPPKEKFLKNLTVLNRLALLAVLTGISITTTRIGF